MRHLLRAKAVLCPGLRVRLTDEKAKEKFEWCYAGGLEEYLLEEIGGGVAPGLLRHADAIIGDFEHRARIALPQRDRNCPLPALWKSVFEGVGDQIDDGFLQPGWVRVNARRHGCLVDHAEVDTFVA